MVLIDLHFQDTLNMDKTTIIKIADLAKIEIKDDELDHIADSLKKILNLVDEMNSVKTDNVVPMSHPLNLSQELRKDEVLEKNERDVFQKDNKYTENGYYKAPIEKDNSKKYRILCLNHVREFNKNWNYFEGMNDDQIYEFLKSDMTWHKPTQSFSSSDNFFKILWNNALKDELNKYKINDQLDHMNQFKFNNNDIKAFSILGVSVGIKWERVQEKFKKLVKKFHPDMNSGNKKYEDKLKVVTLAYTQLKNTYRTKN